MNERAINKLRIKFISISMISFALVTLVMGGVIYAFNLYAVRREAFAVTSEIIQHGGELPAPGEGTRTFGRSLDNWYATRYFAVVFNRNGDVQLMNTSHIASLADDEVKKVAQEARDRYFTFGTLGKYYYQVADRGDGSLIVVCLDFSNQIKMNQRILYIALSLVGTGIFIAAFVVRILSFRVVRSEIRSAEQQKAFITNASHELKTPLAVIRANTEVETMLNGENEWNRSTLRQVERMTGLIQNLVTIVRAEESENSGERREINVGTVLKETVKTFRAVAEQDGLLLKEHAPENLVMIADESQLRQLLTLLIDNSIKYCDKAGTITASAERKGKNIRLQVSNSYEKGKDVDYKRFFERFYREDTSHTQEEKGGYGIGLSIAETLVKQYKGSIDVSWENGEISFVCLLRG
jgi:signal transduction histidine kinase